MLAGICMFSFGDALGKVLVASYPVSELLLLRAAVPLAILLALIWRQRATLPRLERPGLQLLRMVLSTTEVAAFFVGCTFASAALDERMAASAAADAAVVRRPLTSPATA